MPDFAPVQEHPPRSKLELLDFGNIHRKAFDVSVAISNLPADPSVRRGEPPVQVVPRAIVVGSFPFSPETARDLDFEVQGVTWTHLQMQLKALEGKPLPGVTPPRILQEADLTIVEADGRVSHGNAHVAVWATLNDGTKINFSVPHRVSPQTQRYNLHTVTMDPLLDFASASGRRTFAHEAGGYDARTGELFDPHGGRECLAKGILKVVSVDCFAADPLHAYRAFAQMSRRNMRPDDSTVALISKMAAIPLSDDPSVVDLERVRYERFEMFKGAHPVEALRAAINCRIAARDFPVVANLASHYADEMCGVVEAAARTANAQTTWTPDERGRIVLAHLAHFIAEKTSVNTPLDLGPESPASKFVEQFTFGQPKTPECQNPPSREDMHREVLAAAARLASS